MTDLPKLEARRLAKQVIESMRIGRKADGGYDAVQIVYNSTDPTCEEFALEVEEQCWSVGAHTLLTPYSDVRQKRKYVLMPIDSISTENPLYAARGRPLSLASSVDVTLFIGEYDDPTWASLLADKLRAGAQIRNMLTDAFYSGRIRWLFLGWPIPRAARIYGMKVSQFRRIFFESIRQTFSRRLFELVSYYEKSLSGRSTVRIVADDGTDLSFSIEGRPVLVDDGKISEEDVRRGDVGLNIPAGEAYVAPIETSANGRIIFDQVAIPGFGKIRELELEFENGKIRQYRARSGRQAFRRFLDANTGEKDRIAEFGIGCNPAARYTGGCTIIDEKIYRTIHVAIGFNIGTYKGVNKASSHLDMVKDMRHGQVLVDERLAMQDGEPVKG